MRGILIKKIEERKLYHISNYHKRHFIMDWPKCCMLIKVFGGEDDRAHKTIQLESIRSVKAIDEAEEGADDGEFKRSKSWLSKVRKDDDEKSKWNFGFELEISDRTMQLYSPTR